MNQDVEQALAWGLNQDYRSVAGVLAREVERLRARWEETASDNTDYHLSHSDGIYTVSDQNGHVVCEFIRAAEEAARAALEGGQQNV